MYCDVHFPTLNWRSLVRDARREDPWKIRFQSHKHGSQKGLLYTTKEWQPKTPARWMYTCTCTCMYVPSVYFLWFVPRFPTTEERFSFSIFFIICQQKNDQARCQRNESSRVSFCALMLWRTCMRQKKMKTDPTIAPHDSSLFMQGKGRFEQRRDRFSPSTPCSSRYSVSRKKSVGEGLTAGSLRNVFLIYSFRLGDSNMKFWRTRTENQDGYRIMSISSVPIH